MKGMYWLMTDNKTSFAERVQTAVAYYIQKYGRRPVLVQANKKDLDAAATAVDGLTVEGSQYVLPGHLFVVAER